jgi:hypothetical protein
VAVLEGFESFDCVVGVAPPITFALLANTVVDTVGIFIIYIPATRDIRETITLRDEIS